MAYSDEDIKNRFAFHAATNKTKPMHGAIRMLFTNLALELNNNLPESREKSLALTDLQSAAQWANASVATHLAPIVEELQKGFSA